MSNDDPGRTIEANLKQQTTTMTGRRVINTSADGENTSDTPLLAPDLSEGPEEDDHDHSSPNGVRRALSLIAAPIMDEQGSAKSVAAGLFTLFIVGGSIGLAMPKNPGLPDLWYRYVSAAIGYIYFLCWSVSFYPQVVTNFQRRSTMGLSPDFCGLNVLGFACYSAYNVAFFWSPTIQQLYRERYGENAEITVQSNDVAFALHALVLSSITFLQIGYYGGFQAQRPSKIILVIAIAIILVIAIYALLVVAKISTAFNWLDYLYLLSYIKISISLIKYIPQVILNYQRKSTNGWSIYNIILDFTGGTLSDLQLVLDCADLHDFSGITGNLAKFALGTVSILFDIVFLLQHYVFYAESDNGDAAEETPESSLDPEMPLEVEPLL
jgi:cystinosin